MPILLTVRENELVFAREYRVELTAIELVDTKRGKLLKWVIRSLDDNRTLVAHTSYSEAPGSKCVRWATALLDRPIPIGCSVDLETLIGKTAIAVVEIQQRNNREYSRVAELEPDYY